MVHVTDSLHQSGWLLLSVPLLPHASEHCPDEGCNHREVFSGLVLWPDPISISENQKHSFKHLAHVVPILQ